MSIDGRQFMEISALEVGAKYICNYDNAQYFGHAKEIKNGHVSVLLGDKLNEDGDPGDPIDRFGRSVWLKPQDIFPMVAEL